MIDALDIVFDDDANDDKELLELLVLGCGGKASTICCFQLRKKKEEKCLKLVTDNFIDRFLAYR